MDGQEPQANTALNTADITHFPYYIRYEVAPGIIQHRFYRDSDWERQCPQGTPLHDVLRNMRNHGVYSLVEIQEAKTSVVGSLNNGENLFNPIAPSTRYAPNSVVINFSFYVHCPNLFRRSENGPPLDYYGLNFPVGETSITDKFIPVSESYQDLFEHRVMSDGSYATAGPSLHKPLDVTEPTHYNMNTKKGRFYYWARDADGRQIYSPIYQSLLDTDASLNELVSLTQSSPSEITATPLVKGSTLSIKAEIEGLLYNSKGVCHFPDGRFSFASTPSPIHVNGVRNLWTTVAGNISHATEPNERNAITEHPNGTLLSHTYTCRRIDGQTVNAQRELMIAGARFLGFRFEDIEPGKAYGLDGGPSIIQAFIGAKHQVQLLSHGGTNPKNRLFPLNPSTATIREVANVLVVRSGVRLKKREVLKGLFKE